MHEPRIFGILKTVTSTGQKLKFSIKDFFSKCGKNRSFNFLRCSFNKLSVPRWTVRVKCYGKTFTTYS